MSDNKFPEFTAEVSSNHSRDLTRAKQFISESARIGCTAVKFQLFKLEELFAPEILEKSEAHRKRKHWELPLAFIPELSNYTRDLGLKFSCTPFYLDAVAELEPYVDFYKIASYELLWKELFVECAKTGKPIVFSTGMATIDEIKDALNSISGHNTTEVTILKCTSAYPTPSNEANLSAIKTLENQFGSTYNGLKISYGYSDHTRSDNVINRAVHHYNISFLEFHLDLDGKGEEYKSGHCWLPNEMQSLIKRIKLDLEADGDGIFGPTESELADREWRADPSDGLRPLLKTRTSL